MEEDSQTLRYKNGAGAKNLSGSNCQLALFNRSIKVCRQYPPSVAFAGAAVHCHSALELDVSYITLKQIVVNRHFPYVFI